MPSNNKPANSVSPEITSLRSLLGHECIKAHFDKSNFGKRRFLFRGQENDHDAPKAKIFRRNLHKTRSDPEEREYERTKDLCREKRLLTLIKNQAIPYLDFLPRNDLEWLAVAQHHGLPTRLLDWTLNPLAAAYFATKQMGYDEVKKKGNSEESSQKERQAVIYALPIPKEVDDKFLKNLIDNKKDNEDYLWNTAKWDSPKVRVYYPPFLSPRIAAQEGAFTIQDEDYKFPGLVTIKIARAFEGKIKVELNTLGINRHSLFPDIDGLCDTLGWLYKWNIDF